MVRKIKKRKKKFPPKYSSKSGTEISSDIIRASDSTTAVEIDYERKKDSLLSSDSTIAPEIGKESEVDEPLVGSYASLIDKYVLRKIKPEIILPALFALLTIYMVGKIFTQDNEVGKLANFQGIFWCLIKCGFLIAAISLLLLFCNFLFQRIFKKTFMK